MDAPQGKAVAAVVRLPETTGVSVSIIIPVLNEAKRLEDTLRQLYSSLDDDPGFEIIVCDGGSLDDTVDRARLFPCKLVASGSGRALQMNTASQEASGEWLLFLHADSQLPDVWFEQFDFQCDWGFFPIKLSGATWPFRMIEAMMNLRSRISRVATGDQGLFFRRSFFNRLQGYPDIPLMEDVAMSKLARAQSAPVLASTAIVTSSRRWEVNGIINTLVLMWALRLAYFLGVSPDRLHRIYYPPEHQKTR